MYQELVYDQYARIVEFIISPGHSKLHSDIAFKQQM